jgi:methylase of polypeptide subunit release factors
VVKQNEALLELLHELRARGYEFVAVTPATHARVLARPLDRAPTLRDIFGWNRPFAPAQLDEKLLAGLEAANAVLPWRGLLRTKVRVASLAGNLFLHSSFPTRQPDSVFFGPDTYRFASFVARKLRDLRRPGWILDMGAGTGAGGIVAAQLSPASRITLVDVNPAANRLSAINAAFAGVTVDIVEATAIPAGADLVIANPPYMMDVQERTYRDGGELLGGAVALEWARQALSAMTAGGTLLLYTGAAFQDGTAPLLGALEDACGDAGATLAIEELDPDVFGDELDDAGYESVERIAAIGALIGKAF